ncbi:unnamed protein product [Calicophoron daubneyi]|uniref:Secreted protein n=1 Tax=Calicophoron daubneyi TaxID=300641 RepID=A0AAV2TWS9_CALDB
MSFGFAGRRVFALCPIASVLWAHSVPSDGFGNRKLLEASELPAACHNNDLKSIYHKRALEILTRFKETSGCPGISVCVSLSGRTVFDMGRYSKTGGNFSHALQYTCCFVANSRQL